MQRGFSLFEILLALLIMSIIVVGGIQWSNRKHEEASAQQLGHRLFQYGLAVTEYAQQNPAGYTSANPPPDTFYGLSWLQDPAQPNREMCHDPNDISTCETFLGQDFNLNFEALKLAPLIADNPDSMIHVIFEKPVSTTAAPLTIQSVEVGKVYRFNKKTREYDTDVSLDSRAINFANHFTDQKGSAQIFYELFPLDATGMITGKPFTGNANVDSGFLRTDGSNEMDNSIKFSPAAATKSVVGVGDIQFANTTKSKFAGMTVLTPANHSSLTCNVNNSNCTLIPATVDANNHPTNICFLSQAKFRQPENYQGGEHYGCEIFERNGFWMMSNQNTGGDNNRSSCAATCLSWAL